MRRRRPRISRLWCQGWGVRDPTPRRGGTNLTGWAVRTAEEMTARCADVCREHRLNAITFVRKRTGAEEITHSSRDQTFSDSGNKLSVHDHHPTGALFLAWFWCPDCLIRLSMTFVEQEDGDSASGCWAEVGSTGKHRISTVVAPLTRST